MMYKKVLLLVLVAVLVTTPVAASDMYSDTITETVEGDTHFITIYDEAPPMVKTFDKPSPTTGGVRFKAYGDSTKNGLNRMVIHRDIGDLDHIIFASHRIVPTSYNFVDQVPITVYWDPTQQVGGFPPRFNGTYVGSGTMYAYSNSQTEEGHLTLMFDDWDSSIYQNHPDIRIFCWIDAPRPLKFSTIQMGTLYGAVTQTKPLNDDVVCSIYGTVIDSSSFRYGNSTHVYTKCGVFRHKITYHQDNAGIVSIAIDRMIDEIVNPSHITVTSTSQGYTYLTDDTVSERVSAQIPLSEAPFKIDIYSPLTDKTYTYTLYGDGQTDPTPDVPSGGFALALSPASVQVGETVTATLTAGADAPDYSYLVWSATPDDHPDMATWSYRIQDVNGTWYERAANGDEIPISAADAHTYQATPAYPGGHHIGVTVYDHHPPCQGLEQRATLAKPFEALYKSGSSPVRIQVVDERTGALIAGSNIQVIDSQLPPFEGTGINPIIDTTLPQGSEMFYLQRNAYDEPRYRIFADADGYRQVTENQWFSVNPSSPNTVTTVTVQMAATVAPPEDPNNAFVTFRIRDEDGNPVREARVTLDRWTRHALGTRPVTFEVPRGATYQYTVEPIDPGLYPATGSVTVGAEDSYEVNVVLSRTPGDDPGATPPPRDTRTNEEKGKAVIDLLADNAELIATLAILAAVMGLINLIMPGRRRR